MSSNYNRPYSAINDPKDIKVGETIWHTYFLKTPPEPYLVVEEVIDYEEMKFREDGVRPEGRTSGLTGTFWVKVRQTSKYTESGYYDGYLSLTDMSVGADYNDNYVFRTKQEALAAIAMRTLKPVGYDSYTWNPSYRGYRGY